MVFSNDRQKDVKTSLYDELGFKTAVQIKTSEANLGAKLLQGENQSGGDHCD